MKIFVTRVTGYIGFQIALALRRAGHDVWGLVRNPEKTKRITRHEIHPVLDTLQQLDYGRTQLDRLYRHHPERFPEG
jgi:nucleoside-diphosphate-sugar epimerase